jgi:hypothetical protein
MTVSSRSSRDRRRVHLVPCVASARARASGGCHRRSRLRGRAGVVRTSGAVAAAHVWGASLPLAHVECVVVRPASRGRRSSHA